MDRGAIETSGAPLRPISNSGPVLAAALDRACEGWARTRPDAFAKRTLTVPQLVWAGLLLVMAIAAVSLAPSWTAAAVHLLALLGFSAAILLRAAAAIASLFPQRPHYAALQAARLFRRPDGHHGLNRKAALLGQNRARFDCSHGPRFPPNS